MLIPMKDYTGAIIDFVLIDPEDYETVSGSQWVKNADGYACAFKDGKHFKMHHLIVGKKPGLVVDHINQDPLDNRRSNLRHVSKTANRLNSEKSVGKYKRGVSFKKGVKAKPWQARIFQTSLGYFATEDEAHQAYLAAREEYFTRMHQGQEN